LSASRATGKATASKPKVRKAKVTKAKALINDPNYPDEKVMQSVAKRLAKKWSK